MREPHICTCEDGWTGAWRAVRTWVRVQSRQPGLNGWVYSFRKSSSSSGGGQWPQPHLNIAPAKKFIRQQWHRHPQFHPLPQWLQRYLHSQRTQQPLEAAHATQCPLPQWHTWPRLPYPQQWLLWAWTLQMQWRHR